MMPLPSPLSEAAGIACDCLTTARNNGEHELVDPMESDMCAAAMRIIRAGGPVLRDSIANSVSEVPSK